ncbi:MAG: hypothetical protein AABZ53_14445 [Planctomycetota bacterium]
MQNINQTSAVHGRAYLNGVLTAIAILLGVIALKPVELTSTAMAQPATKSPADTGDTALTNAAEQRKVMIAELKNMGKRLERVEAALVKGVKVTEMPELKLPAEFKDALKASRSDKSGTVAKSAN